MKNAVIVGVTTGEPSFVGLACGPSPNPAFDSAVSPNAWALTSGVAAASARIAWRS